MATHCLDGKRDGFVRHSSLPHFSHEKWLANQAEVFCLAEQWQVKDLASILDDVVAGVNHFHVAAAKANLPRENIALIDKDLANRLARVGKVFAPR